MPCSYPSLNICLQLLLLSLLCTGISLLLRAPQHKPGSVGFAQPSLSPMESRSSGAEEQGGSQISLSPPSFNPCLRRGGGHEGGLSLTDLSRASERSATSTQHRYPSTNITEGSARPRRNNSLQARLMMAAPSGLAARCFSQIPGESSHSSLPAPSPHLRGGRAAAMSAQPRRAQGPAGQRGRGGPGPAGEVELSLRASPRPGAAGDSGPGPALTDRTP